MNNVPKCLGHYYSSNAFRRKSGFPGDYMYVRGQVYVYTARCTWRRYVRELSQQVQTN